MANKGPKTLADIGIGPKTLASTEGLFFAPLPGATSRGLTAANVGVAVENALSEIGVLEGHLAPEQQFGPAPTLAMCGCVERIWMRKQKA